MFPYFLEKHLMIPASLLLIRGHYRVNGEELKRRQLEHHQLMSQQGPHFSPYSKAKANYYESTNRKISN